MKNLTHRNNFRLDIPDEGFSNFVWQVQSINIPDVTMETAPVIKGPKYSKLAGNHIAGSGTTYGDLNITFLLDENLEAYAEMYKWMLTMNNPTGPSNHDGKVPVTMLIHVLDNNKDKVTNTFRFINTFPKALDQIEWNYTEAGDVESITCNVTFECSYFEMIVKHKGGEQIIRPIS